MNLRPRRAATLITLSFAAGILVAPVAAQADPISDKKAQAADLQEQLDAAHVRAAELYEQVNNAQVAIAEAETGIAQAEAQLEATRSEYDRIRGTVRSRAAAMYKRAGQTTPLSNFDVDNVTELGTRSRYAEAAAESDEVVLDQLQSVTDDLDAQRADLQAARQAAEDERAQKQRYLDGARAEEDQAKRLYDQANSELQQLVREEEERRAEAARAEAARRAAEQQQEQERAAAPTGDDGGGGGGGGGSAPDTGTPPDNPPPAPSGGAAAAVAYAAAQVGKPYCYAGVGPECYDCSGLTMMAWAQGGVSMPHGATAQGQMFPQVSAENAQPGDLVIFRGGGHVGIYAGGGTMINATHTGDFVKYSPAFREDYTAVVRPG